MKKEFFVYNAFATEAFGGNPAAVFPDASDIPEELLLPIAKQINLVETVYLYPSDTSGVDYKLRYFTPFQELPVAGHPSIASWVTLVELGRVSLVDNSNFVQENLAGRQNIRISEENESIFVYMDQIEPKFSKPEVSLSELAECFNLSETDFDPEFPCEGVDIGLGHLIVAVKDLATLKKAKMDILKLGNLCDRAGLREPQLFTFETHNKSYDLFTRNLSPREGFEDPACGNGNAALGAYLARTKYKDTDSFSVLVEQGHVINMPSLVNVSVDNQHTLPKVTIGGSAIKMVEGSIFL